MKRIWDFLNRYSIGANVHVRRLPIEDIILDPIDKDLIMNMLPIGFTVEISKEEWAPGIWAGSEGIQLTITKVDLDNRKLTLEWK